MIIPCWTPSLFFLVYLRKASEDHLPDNIIKNMETLSKHITIAAPDINEWVPMYFALNPSLSYLIAVTSNLNYFRRFSWVMYLTMASLITEHMGLYRVAPGRIRVFEPTRRLIRMYRGLSLLWILVCFHPFCCRYFGLWRLRTLFGPGRSMGWSALSFRSVILKNLCFVVLVGVSSSLPLLPLRTCRISSRIRIQVWQGLVLTTSYQ